MFSSTLNKKLMTVTLNSLDYNLYVLLNLIFGIYLLNCQRTLDKTYFKCGCACVFVGIIIFSLSALSLKWKTNSGATATILALMAVFITWASVAVVQIKFTIFNVSWLYLVCHIASTSVLLLLVYTRRILSKFKQVNIHRELQLTSNITLPDAGNNSLNMPCGGISARGNVNSAMHRSYMNTFSSTSSFTLPSIIGN